MPLKIRGCLDAVVYKQERDNAFPQRQGEDGDSDGVEIAGWRVWDMHIHQKRRIIQCVGPAWVKRQLSGRDGGVWLVVELLRSWGSIFLLRITL
jgi:hypothetical protein